MQTIPCTGRSEARGRNRWFRLAEAELTLFHQGHAEEARLCLDLYSRQRGRIAPVILVLTAAAAVALAQGIQETVQQMPVAQRTPHPCCPRCQESLHLASATPSIEGTLVVQEALCHTCGACWHDVYSSSGSVLHDA